MLDHEQLAVRINQHLDWLTSESLSSNEMDAALLGEVMINLIGLIGEKNLNDQRRIECFRGTCNKAAGHDGRCNQFDGR